MSQTITKPEPKTPARLNFRLNARTKEKIEQAAVISGMSVSDFAVSRLTAAADEVLERHHSLRLGDAERDFFIALLDSPDAEPTPAARRAVERYDAWGNAQRSAAHP